jgi:hypothetical protein
MTPPRPRLITAAIAVAFVIASLARGNGPFRWDAAHYWAATQAMVGALPAVPAGYWELRGVFTPFIYAPAALLTRVVGDNLADWAVCLQNSVVLAAAAVLLFPAVIAIWRPVTTLMRIVTAALVWAVTSGFAAYPLVDLYAAFAIIGLLLLVRSDRRWVLGIAGVLAGVAMNIRPAYIIVIVLLVIVVIVWKRVAGLLLTAGVVLALVPQVLMNVVRSGTWSPFPAGSDELIALQSSYASYIVRYDTMIGDESARQFYCSSDMARLIGDAVPHTAGELALSLINALPTSIVFSLEKIAASLSWHAIAPYTAAVRPLDVAYGLGITAIAVAGLVALFFIASRRTDGARDTFGTAVLATMAAGTAVTLVSSTTETRFALILPLLGIVGLAQIAGASPATTWRTGRWWVAFAVAATVAVIVLGAIGLAEPAPRGEVTAEICASA